MMKIDVQIGGAWPPVLRERAAPMAPARRAVMMSAVLVLCVAPRTASSSVASMMETAAPNGLPLLLALRERAALTASALERVVRMSALRAPSVAQATAPSTVASLMTMPV